MSEIDDFDEPYADATDSIGTIRIGKALYGVSLIWQEADDDVDAASAARSAAADTTVNGDFFCLRPQSRQFGIGLKEKGHAKNMPSLGAHLAEVRRGTQASWVGLFEVEGGFYLIAVRDELILAQSDRFYADEMQARGELDNLLNLDAWGEIIAPESFEVESSVEKDIAKLVSAGKPPRLRDIDRMSSMSKWGAGIIVVMLLLGGGYYYMDMVNEQALQAIEDARIAAEKVNLPLVGQQVVQVPPMPWEDRPKAGPYMDACMTSMRKAVLDFPGWTPVKIECDASAAVRLDIARSNTLEMGGGTVNWIRWALDRSPELSKAGILPSGPDGATISWVSAPIEKYAPDLNPRAPDVGKTRFYLQSWFEEAFTTITFPKAQQNDFVRSVSFTFSTGYEPTKFSEILARVPGLTIDKVSVDLKKLPISYMVEGSIHEQLPLPKNARRPGAPPDQPGASAGPSASAAPIQPRT